MESLIAVESALAQIAKRRRLIRGLQEGGRFMFIGALLWLGLILGYLLLPIPSQLPLAGAGLVMILGVVGFIRGFWSTPDLISIARWVDHKEGFQDRLSTALEFCRPDPNPSSPGISEWRSLLLREANLLLPRLDAKRLLPWTRSRVWNWNVGLCLLALALLWVPPYRSPGARQKAEDLRRIAEVGKELQDFAQEQRSARPPVLPKTTESIQELAQLGDRFVQVPAGKTEALRDLANLTQKLEQRLQESATNQALERMQQAAREPVSPGRRAELQRKLDAAREALGASGANREQMDALKRDLERLKQAAQNQAADSPEAKQERDRQLARDLAQLKQKAQAAGLPLNGLEQAMQALSESNPSLFLKDLDLALQQLDQLQQLANSVQSLQTELAQAGKNLAEQLDRAQTESAQATMEALSSQLEKSEMSDADLQRISEELEKALKPAKAYGEVGQHLSRALNRLRQDGKSGSGKKQAAKDLRAAAEALSKLSQQLASAEETANALNALQQAQLAIASGRSFAECKNPSKRRSIGRGGKPGSGVGTWADADGAAPPEDTGLWDNTGIRRPDLDPRGLTDRGDGEHNPALAPTQVKGQFNPGGSMQSVTLKGVFIRGQSDIGFREAATSAQVDAQNALNQDKVPRAYQQTVRDYFDDLKK